MLIKKLFPFRYELSLSLFAKETRNDSMCLDDFLVLKNDTNYHNLYNYHNSSDHIPPF